MTDISTDTDLCTDARCSLDRSLSRRGVLGAALAGGGFTIGSAVVQFSSPAAAAASRNTIVVLSMRGAADGLSLVVPHGDRSYYAARPTIAIPQSRLLVADDFFGLHPKLAPLTDLWKQGRLAAVHATGLPVANRSHFSAMEEVEDADPGSTVRSGWLNRLLGSLPGSGGSPIHGLGVGAVLPTSLVGRAPVMSFDELEDAVVAGAGSFPLAQRRTPALRATWGTERGPLGTAYRSALQGVADLKPARSAKSRGGRFPDTDLGKALASVSQTLRARLPVDVVTVDHGNWDMHTNLGTLEAGRMIDNATEFAQAVAAFFEDLGSLSSRVTLVTISEFGRRVVENANRGLDHGWGNVMFLAGAGVKGGRYYGSWPGLKTTLDADLTVTTDYRSVLAEVVAARTGASLATVFPGFRPESIGVMSRS